MGDAPLLYRTLRRVLPPFLHAYLDLTFEGLEHVPDGGGAIIASNHLAFIDSVVVVMEVPRPVYFLGKAEYWDSWRTRWFFEGTGVVPVHRDDGGRAEAALRTGVSLLEDGRLLGIYPEGTRSPDGRLYRGKTGPVRMALQSGAPIIPSAVIGTDDVQPPGSYAVRRGSITVRYGEPLDLSRYADRDDDPFALRTATDELMYEIMLLSGQEYVDEYASRVKRGEIEPPVDPAAEPGRDPDRDAGADAGEGPDASDGTGERHRRREAG